MTEQTIGQWISDTGFVIGRYDPNNASPVQDMEIAKRAWSYDDYKAVYNELLSSRTEAKKKTQEAAEKRAKDIAESAKQTKHFRSLRGAPETAYRVGRAVVMSNKKAAGLAALLGAGGLVVAAGKKGDARRYRPASQYYDDYLGKSDRPVRRSDIISKIVDPEEVRRADVARLERQLQMMRDHPTGHSSEVRVNPPEHLHKAGTPEGAKKGAATKAANKAAQAGTSPASSTPSASARRMSFPPATGGGGSSGGSPPKTPPSHPYPKGVPGPPKQPSPFPEELAERLTKKKLRHKVTGHARTVGTEALKDTATQKKIATWAGRAAMGGAAAATPVVGAWGRKQVKNVRARRAGALGSAKARNAALETELQALKHAGARNLKVAAGVGGAGLAAATVAPFLANRHRQHRENAWPGEFNKAYEEIEKVSTAPLKAAFKKPYTAVMGRYGSKAPGVEGKKGLDLLGHDWDRALNMAEPRIRRTYELGRDTRAAADEFRAGLHGQKKTKLSSPGTWGNLSMGQKVGLGALGAGGLVVGSKLAGPKPYPYQQQ